MLDPEIQDGLEFIIDSIEIIQRRFRKIKTSSDFVRNDAGETILDSIAMRLQAMGEKVKRMEHHFPGFLQSQGVQPEPIIRFRDFISHNYEKMDADLIFEICKNHLPPLQIAVRAIFIKSESA